jgi:hypothetical protein
LDWVLRCLELWELSVLSDTPRLVAALLRFPSQHFYTSALPFLSCHGFESTTDLDKPCVVGRSSRAFFTSGTMIFEDYYAPAGQSSSYLCSDPWSTLCNTCRQKHGAMPATLCSSRGAQGLLGNVSTQSRQNTSSARIGIAKANDVNFYRLPCRGLL